jgi:hypothetical protein
MEKFRYLRRADIFLPLKRVSLRKSLLFLIPCLTKYTNNKKIKVLFSPYFVFMFRLLFCTHRVYLCAVYYSLPTQRIYVFCSILCPHRIFKCCVPFCPHRVFMCCVFHLPIQCIYVLCTILCTTVYLCVVYYSLPTQGIYVLCVILCLQCVFLGCVLFSDQAGIISAYSINQFFFPM